MNNKYTYRWKTVIGLVILGIIIISIAGGKGSCWFRKNDHHSSGSSGRLATPSNLEGTLGSSTQIDLSWTDNSTPESGFSIERKTGGGSYAQVGTAGSNVTVYSNTSLTESTTFSYRVKATAYNSEADSLYSNEISIATYLAGTWTATSTVSPPISRSNHTAVWTGSEMVVWGGWDGSSYFNSGGEYDLTNWSDTTTTDAPVSRTGHTAIWCDTENEMLVWGGKNDSGTLNDGSLYNPTLNTWDAITTTGAPVSRTDHTAIWTGSTMIIWGGSSDTGGIYNPTTKTWDTDKTYLIDGTDAPSVRSSHTAVWTGSGAESWRNKMIVWGGKAGSSYFDIGGIYDPDLDEWKSMTNTTNAPAARAYHTAIWTGSKMIVWGGTDLTSSFNDGAIYDPEEDTWTTITTENAPEGRARHTAIWTGSKMIVWGGYSNVTSVINTGGVYNPTTDTWTPTSLINAPAARDSHTAIWTDTKMIIWGGVDFTTYYNTGGVYEPE